MRAARLTTSFASRCVAMRPYSAAAPKVEPELEVTEPESHAESSTAAQRRLLRQTPPTSSQPKPKRRRGPTALALLRAQKLAEALKLSPPPSNSTIPLSTSLTVSPNSAPPTLEDLEEKRPKRPPLPLSHHRYPRQYQKLYSSLDVAFTAKQLQRLAPKLGVKAYKGKSKALAIRDILQNWGWTPPLTPAQQEVKARKEIEVVEKDWELTKAEMWLLMRDAEILRPAVEQGVRFSIPPNDDVRVLRGVGQKQNLVELDAVIKEKQEAVRLHTRSVYPGLSSEAVDGLLGVVMDASGACIEPVGSEQIQISASSAAALEKAGSLIEQAAQHSLSKTLNAKAILSPSDDLEFGLYPHFPAPNDSVPWHDLSQNSKPLFRLKRVTPWEVKVGPRETVHEDEKLDEMSYAPVGGSGLQSSIAQQIGAGEGITTTVRFGHVVYPNDRSESSPLTPPVNTIWSPIQAASSQVLAGQPVFMPNLPPFLVHFPLDSKARTRRELQYRHADGRILQLSYDVMPTVAGTNDEKVPEAKEGWHKELDEYMDRLSLDTADPIKEDAVVQARLYSGKASQVMMPDRPVDISIISSTSYTDVDAQSISSVSGYLHNPTGLPPSSILHQQSDWKLLSAQELEVVESKVSSENDASQSPLILRTVRATDLTFGIDRSIRYAELETEGGLTPAFWAELAKVTRVLAPGAGALRGEVY